MRMTNQEARSVGLVTVRRSGKWRIGWEGEENKASSAGTQSVADAVEEDRKSVV